MEANAEALAFASDKFKNNEDFVLQAVDCSANLTENYLCKGKQGRKNKTNINIKLFIFKELKIPAELLSDDPIEYVHSCVSLYQG